MSKFVNRRRVLMDGYTRGFDFRSYRESDISADFDVVVNGFAYDELTGRKIAVGRVKDTGVNNYVNGLPAVFLNSSFNAFDSDNSWGSDSGTNGLGDLLGGSNSDPMRCYFHGNVGVIVTKQGAVFYNNTFGTSPTLNNPSSGWNRVLYNGGSHNWSKVIFIPERNKFGIVYVPTSGTSAVVSYYEVDYTTGAVSPAGTVTGSSTSVMSDSKRSLIDVSRDDSHIYVSAGRNLYRKPVSGGGFSQLLVSAYDIHNMHVTENAIVLLLKNSSNITKIEVFEKQNFVKVKSFGDGQIAPNYCNPSVVGELPVPNIKFEKLSGYKNQIAFTTNKEVPLLITSNNDLETIQVHLHSEYSRTQTDVGHTADTDYDLVVHKAGVTILHALKHPVMQHFPHATGFFSDDRSIEDIILSTLASDAAIYHGDDNKEVTFPLGHAVVAWAGFSQSYQNQTYKLMLTTDTTAAHCRYICPKLYNAHGSGVLLDGEWQYRGYAGTLSGVAQALFVRVR